MEKLSPTLLATLTAGCVLWCGGVAVAMGPFRLPLARRVPSRLTGVEVFLALTSWLFIDFLVGIVFAAIRKGQAAIEPIWLLTSNSISRTLLVAILLLMLREVRLPWRWVGFHRYHWRTWVKYGVAGICFWGPLTLLANVWVRAFIEQKRPHPVQELFSKSLETAAWPMVIFSVAVAAPIFEELLFRGILQTWMTRWIGPVGAIVATSALFGGVHAYTWPDPVPLFVFGLGLGYVYQTSRSLVVPIVMHATFNFANLLILILST